MEHIRQEYPVYGTTDYRHPAIELLQENGSRISEFQYDSYEIIAGKPKLSGLPATYTESEEEAQTLRIFLKDALTGAKLALLYTILMNIVQLQEVLILKMPVRKSACIKYDEFKPGSSG